MLRIRRRFPHDAAKYRRTIQEAGPYNGVWSSSFKFQFVGLRGEWNHRFFFVKFTKYVAIYLYKCYNSKLEENLLFHFKRSYYRYGISGKDS